VRAAGRAARSVTRTAAFPLRKSTAGHMTRDTHAGKRQRCNRTSPTRSEFGRHVAGDLHADANFRDHWRRPGHISLPWPYRLAGRTTDRPLSNIYLKQGARQTDSYDDLISGMFNEPRRLIDVARAEGRRCGPPDRRVVGIECWKEVVALPTTEEPAFGLVACSVCVVIVKWGIDRQIL
jgi:hypothetical protein